MSCAHFMLLCLLATVTLPSYAFSFQEGRKYVLFSGYSNFTDICLQDVSGSTVAGSPVYTYGTRTKGARYQEWILERASTTDTLIFYIVNAGTGKYLGGSTETNKYSIPFSTDKAHACIWTITPITDEQILIDHTDNYGVRRFLHATDTTSMSYPSIKATFHLNRNSRFAWIITPEGEGLDAIQPVNASSLQVSVRNRHILVSGTDHYTIRKTDGSSVPHNSELIPGTYIVTTHLGSVKIAVP